MFRERYPPVWEVIAVLAYATVTIESASAHDKGCDGNPVPDGIKLDCCGKADEHQLKPEQIKRGPNNEYIISFERWTFVVPADQSQPSADACSHIFFADPWITVRGTKYRWSALHGWSVLSDPPRVWCFLTPLDF
jgi:hypothetical protein